MVIYRSEGIDLRLGAHIGKTGVQSKLAEGESLASEKKNGDIFDMAEIQMVFKIKFTYIHYTLLLLCSKTNIPIIGLLLPGLAASLSINSYTL